MSDLKDTYQDKLLSQVLNLKCCGNCAHRDDDFECAIELPMTRWWNCCGKWQSDGITRSEREIK